MARADAMVARFLPCPFCGARLESKRSKHRDADLVWQHPSNGCLIEGVGYLYDGEDLSRWNKRAGTLNSGDPKEAG